MEMIIWISITAATILVLAVIWAVALVVALGFRGRSYKGKFWQRPTRKTIGVPVDRPKK